MVSNIIHDFISSYATLLLYTAITAIAGIAAGAIKKIYTEKVNTKTKKEVVKTVVYAVQQLYKGLDGEAKKQKAIESISAMLAEKGINITPLEIDMLIEAAIAEAKDVWNKTPDESQETSAEYVTTEYIYEGDDTNDYFSATD